MTEMNRGKKNILGSRAGSGSRKTNLDTDAEKEELQLIMMEEVTGTHCYPVLFSIWGTWETHSNC